MPPRAAPAIQRDRRDDVLEAVRLELLQHLAEATRLELEHAVVSAREIILNVSASVFVIRSMSNSSPRRAAAG